MSEKIFLGRKGVEGMDYPEASQFITENAEKVIALQKSTGIGRIKLGELASDNRTDRWKVRSTGHFFSRIGVDGSLLLPIVTHLAYASSLRKLTKNVTFC